MSLEHPSETDISISDVVSCEQFGNVERGLLLCIVILVKIVWTIAVPLWGPFWVIGYLAKKYSPTSLTKEKKE